jgi:hypothetical protein
MAVLVTAMEVKEIMDNCTVSDTVVDTMIIGADALLVKVFAGDDQLGMDLMKEIERWLSAHMIASTLQRTTTKEKLGEAEFTYTGKFGENLSSTPYGQMVLTLDFTGKLKNTVGKAQASIFAIPTEYTT